MYTSCARTAPREMLWVAAGQAFAPYLLYRYFRDESNNESMAGQAYAAAEDDSVGIWAQQFAWKTMVYS